MFWEITYWSWESFGTLAAVEKHSKHDWREAISESLYKTVSGYGLRSFSKGIGMSEWIAAAVPRIPSTQQIHAGRSGLLPWPADLDLQDGTCRLPQDVMMDVNLLNLWGTWSRNVQERIAHDMRDTTSLWKEKRKKKKVEHVLKENGYTTKIESRIPT